tara:strand:+ start:76 stop:261 length:186 start_codon:yes stop_codon:yes gene_type:complete
MKTKIHIGALYKHWRNPNTEMILLTADEYFVTVYNVHTQDKTQMRTQVFKGSYISAGGTHG